MACLYNIRCFFDSQNRCGNVEMHCFWSAMLCRLFSEYFLVFAISSSHLLDSIYIPTQYSTILGAKGKASQQLRKRFPPILTASGIILGAKSVSKKYYRAILRHCRTILGAKFVSKKYYKAILRHCRIILGVQQNLLSSDSERLQNA